jgi:hypothetical protein
VMRVNYAVSERDDDESDEEKDDPFPDQGIISALRTVCQRLQCANPRLAAFTLKSSLNTPLMRDGCLLPCNPRSLWNLQTDMVLSLKCLDPSSRLRIVQTKENRCWIAPGRNGQLVHLDELVAN